MIPWRKPPRVAAGSTIGIAALSGPLLEPERLTRGLGVLHRLGYRTRLAANVRSRHGYLAGSDDARLAGFSELIDDPDVAAILMLRGGYGAPRLLDRFPYEKLGRRPLLLAGHSDFTAVASAVAARLGLATLHAPMLATGLGGTPRPRDLAWLTAAWSGSPGGLAGRELRFGARRVLRPGRVRGPLVGGCLSLIAAACGTPYAFPLDGAILFWEDVGENPYELDRMLTQLRLAGTFARIKGMLVGDLRDCRPRPGRPSLSVRGMLREVLAGTRFPVVEGLPFGHGSRQIALPVGAMAELNTSNGTLRFLEDVVA